MKPRAVAAVLLAVVMAWTTAGITAAQVDTSSLWEVPIGQPVTLPGDLIAPFFNDPPFTGSFTLTITDAASIGPLPFSSGSQSPAPEGRWVYATYGVQNDLSYRLQIAQVERLFALRDDRDRQWERGGASAGRAQVEMAVATAFGVREPAYYVEPGMSARGLLLFDVPADATGLQLVSGALRIRTPLEQALQNDLVATPTRAVQRTRLTSDALRAVALTAADVGQGYVVRSDESEPIPIANVARRFARGSSASLIDLVLFDERIGTPEVVARAYVNGLQERVSITPTIVASDALPEGVAITFAIEVPGARFEASGYAWRRNGVVALLVEMNLTGLKPLALAMKQDDRLLTLSHTARSIAEAWRP